MKAALGLPSCPPCACSFPAFLAIGCVCGCVSNFTSLAFLSSDDDDDDDDDDEERAA